MNIDFHTHTKLSKKRDFSLDYFHRMIAAARKAGLHATALTEHFNTRNFHEIYDTLDRELPYRDHYYDVNGFRVFCGIEMDIREKGHILLIGERSEIRAIQRTFQHRKDKNNFPSGQELFDEADNYNVVKIGAHPTRRSTPLTHLSPELLSRLDFLDLNGRETATRKELEAFATKLNKPIVAGSDSHHPIQFGAVFNTLRDDCRTIDDIRDCIQEGRYGITVSPIVSLRVGAAKMIKRTIKLMGRA
ncbi:PHP-associated domain-containing protein [Cohnella sp. GCM10027633]|uniref:PHP-associated domain-containing protein n=1 Tax=unclassified Cohnella TaxID=2636738 RepID=UPI003635E3AF